MIVYRLYDAAATLLYVGVTEDIPQRMSSHRRCQPWWPEVATTNLTKYADRRAALQAEAVAIRDEHPRYNIAGAETDWRTGRPVRYGPPPPPTSVVHRPDEEWAALEAELVDAAAGVREQEALALHHRQERDGLILELRADDPQRWSYNALANAIGCSPELVAAIIKGRTRTGYPPLAQLDDPVPHPSE